MSYIGRKPTVGNFQICDAISVVNGQAAYTMQVGSVNVIPQSANHMIVSLNGTIQKPNSSFTVSGATITFASNLATGDVIDFIQILGDVLDLGVPSDATVSLAKMTANNVDSDQYVDGSIDAAHLNADVITGQTAETSVATDDLILLSDTSASGALKKMTRSNFVSGIGGTNTPAFARDSGGGNVEVTSKNTWTLVTMGGAIIDTDSDYDSSTGKFTPSSAGNYLIYGMMSIYADQIQNVTPAIYRNGSEYIAFRPAGFNATVSSPNYYLTSSAFNTVMNFNGSSDYIQMYISANWGTGSFYINGRATFGAIKIIE